MTLPLLVAGCTTAGSAASRGACYDVRGRLEPTILTKGECDAHFWQWRVSGSGSGSAVM